MGGGGIAGLTLVLVGKLLLDAIEVVEGICRVQLTLISASPAAPGGERETRRTADVERAERRVLLLRLLLLLLLLLLLGRGWLSRGRRVRCSLSLAWLLSRVRGVRLRRARRRGRPRSCSCTLGGGRLRHGGRCAECVCLLARASLSQAAPSSESSELGRVQPPDPGHRRFGEGCIRALRRQAARSLVPQ